MKIKTSEEIINQYDDEWDSREEDDFTFSNKKWVAVDDMINEVHGSIGQAKDLSEALQSLLNKLQQITKKW